MNGRDIIQSLHSGKRVYSSAMVSSSPIWPNMVKQTGVDFVFVDTEHTPIDRQTLSSICQTYQALGVPPVVRIPCNDPFEACKALDAGAGGIIGPYVESPEQVRGLVGAVKYRPLKGRRLQDAVRDPHTLEPELRSYLERRNGDKILICNIESVPAIQNLHEICSVPGLERCSSAHMISRATSEFRAVHPSAVRRSREPSSGSREHNVGMASTTGSASTRKSPVPRCNLVMHSSDLRSSARRSTRYRAPAPRQQTPKFRRPQRQTAKLLTDPRPLQQRHYVSKRGRLLTLRGRS
jgi:hypothetical protein